MELWLSLTLLVLCVAGFILALLFLKQRPALRRFTMLLCVIVGAMMLLYSCLVGFMLSYAQPDPEPVEESTTQVQEPLLPYNTLYLSLDDFSRSDGVFLLTFTAMDEDLTPLTTGTLPLDENLQSSLIPGWDALARRCNLYTAKEFSQYWDYSKEQGFPAIGSLCRFTLTDGKITELNEITPGSTAEQQENGHEHTHDE